MFTRDYGFEHLLSPFLGEEIEHFDFDKFQRFLTANFALVTPCITEACHDAALPRWRWSPAGWCRGAGAGWCTVSGWGLSCSSGAGTRTGLVAVPVLGRLVHNEFLAMRGGWRLGCLPGRWWWGPWTRGGQLRSPFGH